MSNTESIIVGLYDKTSTWRKSDTTSTLGLFGTATGAGVLFFLSVQALAADPSSC